jgi:hypothetical protein
MRSFLPRVITTVVFRKTLETKAIARIAASMMKVRNAENESEKNAETAHNAKKIIIEPNRIESLKSTKEPVILFSSMPRFYSFGWVLQSVETISICDIKAS